MPFYLLLSLLFVIAVVSGTEKPEVRMTPEQRLALHYLQNEASLSDNVWRGKFQEAWDDSETVALPPTESWVNFRLKHTKRNTSRLVLRARLAYDLNPLERRDDNDDARGLLQVTVRLCGFVDYINNLVNSERFGEPAAKQFNLASRRKAVGSLRVLNCRTCTRMPLNARNCNQLSLLEHATFRNTTRQFPRRLPVSIDLRVRSTDSGVQKYSNSRDRDAVRRDARQLITNRTDAGLLRVDLRKSDAVERNVRSYFEARRRLPVIETAVRPREVPSNGQRNGNGTSSFVRARRNALSANDTECQRIAHEVPTQNILLVAAGGSIISPRTVNIGRCHGGCRPLSPDTNDAHTDRALQPHCVDDRTSSFSMIFFLMGTIRRSTYRDVIIETCKCQA